MADAAVAETVSEDGFLGGRLLLRQPRRGHRAGSDAVLLAAAAPPEISGLVLDVGAGVGTAGLALAALRPQVRFGLVEKDPVLAALARDNLTRNGLADRGSVFEADLFDGAARRAAGLADQTASLIVTNPPFLEAGKSRISPDKGRQAAHVLAADVTLADWMAACLALLGDGGEFIMIHRADALPDMLAALKGGAGDIMLKPIMPQAEKPAVRLILRARKGRRGPLSIAPPFILNVGNRFTPEAEAVHRGAALMDW